jgi:pilus assembly protein CpaB
MRPKSLMLLLLALGCGLVASIGISQVMDARNRNAAPEVEKEPIYVALKDIKVNEPLSEKNLKLEDWPKEKIPSDAVRDLKDIQGQRAGGIILADEPLRKAKFAVDHRIEEIPKGYRVVAVPADAVSATGNLLQPGDRVDMLLAIKNNSGVQNQYAKTILQDIRIFAVNEQWQAAEGNKSNETIAAKTVSLLVTPAQAETIALASEMGKIRLVLRHPDDEGISDTQGTEESELLSGGVKSNRNKEIPGATGDQSGGILAWLKNQQAPQQAQPVAAPMPPPVQEEHFTMEVLKADELSHVDFARQGEGRWRNLGESGNGAGGAGMRTTSVAPPAPTTVAPPAPTTDGAAGFKLPTDIRLPGTDS